MSGRWRRVVASLAVAAVCFGAGWVTNDAVTVPDCPEEDSCAIDYRDGGWHITEATP